MIANESEYLESKKKERDFSALVDDFKAGKINIIPGESPGMRQVRLNATQSMLDDLRREIKRWEDQLAAAAN